MVNTNENDVHLRTRAGTGFEFGGLEVLGVVLENKN